MRQYIEHNSRPEWLFSAAWSWAAAAAAAVDHLLNFPQIIWWMSEANNERQCETGWWYGEATTITLIYWTDF